MRVRRTAVDQPIDAAVQERLAMADLTFSAADIERDPAWRFAPFGCLSVVERDALNLSQLTAYARFFGLPMACWRLPIEGDLPFGDDAALNNELYAHEPQLRQYFVAGTPAQLTDTVTPARGLANGAQCLQDMLVFEDAAPEADLAEWRAACELVGGGGRYAGPMIEVPRPHSVIVRLSGTACADCGAKQRAFGPAGGRPLRCGDCALRCDIRLGTGHLWHGQELPDRVGVIAQPLVPGEGLIALTKRGPKKWRAKPAVVKLNSLFAAQQGAPKSVLVRMHGVSPAFAMTDYKLQGMTMLRLVIVGLCQAPTFQRSLVKAGEGVPPFYVLLSRAKTFDGLRFLTNDASQLALLGEQQHSMELSAWNEGYDADGMWSDELAYAAFAVVEARRAAARGVADAAAAATKVAAAAARKAARAAARAAKRAAAARARRPAAAAAAARPAPAMPVGAGTGRSPSFAAAGKRRRRRPLSPLSPQRGAGLRREHDRTVSSQQCFFCLPFVAVPRG